MKGACTGSLFVLVAAALPAQAPADHALLHRLDSTLTAGLPLETTRSDDGVVRQLHDGVRWLLEWQRTGQRTIVERALFSFDAAASRRPDWAWPRYFAARAHLLLSAADAPLLLSAGTRDIEPHLNAGLRHLAAALDADSSFAPARRYLAELLFASGDRELDREMRRVVHREVALDPPLVLMQIVHARALRTERKYQEALAAFDAAVFGGGDRALLALERARTLTALGDTAAAVAAYWHGVDRLTPAARPWYRQDLGWIVGEDSLAAFDAQPLERLGSWLHRFWAERDAAAANQPGERLRTHLARWVVAHEEFRVPTPWRRNFYTRFWGIAGGADCIASASKLVDSLPLHPPTIPGDPRFREPLIDHRGFLVLRHGAPIARTAVMTPAEEEQAEELNEIGMVPARPGTVSSGTLESWVYWIEGGWRSFHLAGSSVFGGHAPTTLRTYLPLSEAPWLALAQILPKYLRTAILLNPDRKTGTPKSCFEEVTGPVREMRADAHVGVTSDSDSPPLLRPWNAAVAIYGVGSGADGSGRALVTFAVPTRHLAADTLADGDLAWPLRFRVVAWRGRDGATWSADTLRTFTAPSAGSDAILQGYHELPLEGGDWQVAVRIRQADDSSGTYALRRTVPIPEAPRLALSDLVPGIEGGPAWRAAEGFPLNPRNAWPRGGMVELWFQVRGLDPGTPFRVRMEVQSTERGRRDQVRVSTDETSAGAVTTLRRALGLQNLPQGTYRLVVTVEAGEQSVSREQEIRIVER